MEKTRYALKNFILAALVYTASLYLIQSGRAAAIILGVCFAVGGVKSYGKVADSSSTIAFSLGIVLIVVGATVKSQTFNTIMKYFGAVALAYTGLIQIVATKLYGKNGLIKFLEVLVRLALGGLIIAGAAIMVFTNKESMGRNLILGGCIIWCLHTIYALFHIGSKDSSSSHISSASGGESIGELEVRMIVEKIANSWTGTEDYLPDGATVRYRVNVEVYKDTIKFTVNGKLNYVTEKNASAVQTSLSGKYSRAMQNILNATNDELSKYCLPYEYEVTVEAGELE